MLNLIFIILLKDTKLKTVINVYDIRRSIANKNKFRLKKTTPKQKMAAPSKYGIIILEVLYSDVVIYFNVLIVILKNSIQSPILKIRIRSLFIFEESTRTLKTS